jgi:hypothetical protein
MQCEKKMIFWKQVFNWWANNLKVWLQVDLHEILFGVPNERNEPIINQINFLILYGKYYIYKGKKALNTLHLYEFLLECKKQMIIKKDSETNTGQPEQVDKFERNWGELYECLCE